MQSGYYCEPVHFFNIFIYLTCFFEQICKLREGVGKVTHNVAEYRGLILGLKYALEKGFFNIHVRGDSKLVCMQFFFLHKKFLKKLDFMIGSLMATFHHILTVI